MTQFIVIRPGQTDYDEQARVKGRLSIPLNRTGAHQVAGIVRELQDQEIEHVYSAPCRAALQTAQAVGDAHEVGITTLEALQNLDRGLWQGKLIQTIRQQQPKAFRGWQENPETLCPPEGEMLHAAESRLTEAFGKLSRRHKSGTIAVVIPEPLATIGVCTFGRMPRGDLWTIECVSGRWEAITGELQHAEVR